ncbi:MAG TPA: hypothetical protein VFE91_05280 [Nitrososphaerales archaeon]|nr:hypothetical protein [Nitrososphaerales archaeon]
MVGDRYCLLCREEDGKPEESGMVVLDIVSKHGGRARTAALCLAHARSIGTPESSYEEVVLPPQGLRSRGPVRTNRQARGGRGKGEISRSQRVLGRYSKTQRGRLGE